ncbi:MAG TPA: hypothetical protein VGM33_12365 [Baekduia sp.]
MCATLVTCLLLLLPRPTMFTLDVADIRRRASAADIAATHAMAASTLEKLHRRNEVALERMVWTFSCATAMLVLQVVLWSCALLVA